MEEENPVLATLYIFVHSERIVRIAIGQWPPDPGRYWDSLIRIPIAANGARPPWRMFTHKMNEPLQQALARSRWPDDNQPDPHTLRLRSARLARTAVRNRERPRRRGNPGGCPAPAVATPLAATPLGHTPSGTHCTYDRRTRQYLRVAPEVAP